MRHHHLYILFNAVMFGIIILFTWLLRSHTELIVYVGLLCAQIASVLFLANLNLHFTILVIRKSTIQSVKTSFVKISRKLMRFHIPFAITGTAIILIHAVIMLRHYTAFLGWTNPKLISGFVAILVLGANLFAGYLRHKRASGFRRKFHLRMAMTFAVFALIHLLWPI